VRIAFVVQRYGTQVSGGSELHCRWLAEHLAKHFDVSVITTCALSYVDWRNHYPTGTKIVNGVPVRRFKVAERRDLRRFHYASQEVFYRTHSEADELRWLELQGPKCPDLVSYVRDRASDYDLFIFFTYLYYTTFHSLPLVREKSLLVPTAHDEPPIRLGIFRRLFSLPRFIVYNTVTERNLVSRILGSAHVPSEIVGVGIDRSPQVDTEAFRRKHGIDGPFALYVGRIDQWKGCPELIAYFARYRRETGDSVRLVLVGRQEIPLPDVDGVVRLGFLSEDEKAAAIQACSVVIVPSRFESLSMVALEAGLAGKPVLANGNCHVLRDLCIESGGGLYYTCYDEFRECLRLLQSDAELREKLGQGGRRYVETHYDWAVVERKYLEIINSLRL